MKKSSQIAGLCGFVLLLFGIVEFMFSREFSLFTIVHLAGGASLVLFCLAFNLGGVWSSLGARSTRYGANAVLYTVIFLGILVLINILANTHPVRKDLTEGGLFSLSDQSQKVLDNLEEDVQALGFFQAAKGTPLDDLLKNYANYSPRFTYEFIDLQGGVLQQGLYGVPRERPHPEEEAPLLEDPTGRGPRLPAAPGQRRWPRPQWRPAW